MRWWKGVGASVRGGRRPPSSSRLFLCDAAVNWVMADAQPDRRYSRAGRLTETEPLPLPECCALVLQGGGALGSYQAGVYESLDDWNVPLNWVAGISIGAINAALIAGNPPEHRLERLRRFWDIVSRSEEHTSELQSLMRISYAVFCLKKKKKK